MAPDFPNKRFLREGILDEIIDNLQEWDVQSWLSDSELFSPSFAIFISLFESNRLILKKIESMIEQKRQSSPQEDYRDLAIIAAYLQMGLRNAYEGLKEEIENPQNRPQNSNE